MADARLARIATQIDNVGETIQLARGTAANVTVKATVAGYSPEELAGAGFSQNSRKIIIAGATLASSGFPAPPRQGDVIHAGGLRYTVQGCDTRRIRDDVAVHIVNAMGG